MANKKNLEGTGKLLNNLIYQNESASISTPIINNIDNTYQHDKYYFFEYELDNPQRKLNSTMREIFIKHTNSFILFAPSVFLITNIKNVKKFIENISIHQRELQIINFSLIAIEKGYIISNWLKRI